MYKNICKAYSDQISITKGIYIIYALLYYKIMLSATFITFFTLLLFYVFSNLSTFLIVIPINNIDNVRIIITTFNPNALLNVLAVSNKMYPVTLPKFKIPSLK